MIRKEASNSVACRLLEFELSSADGPFGRFSSWPRVCVRSVIHPGWERVEIIFDAVRSK